MVFDIGNIIARNDLIAYFQPVISVARMNICGLEGLIRGINTDNGEIIPPLFLFDAAEDRNLLLELDRACRDTVIQTYRTIYMRRKDILLFLNINSAILDKAVGSKHLINMVREYQISPNDVVIEINESQVQDTQLLKTFVDNYRKYGFLIALDDVGYGYSNMDRIPLIKPDIVKTNMALIRNICTDFYVQEVFRSLIILSTKIGAMVVAEGVETVEEANQTLQLGANMIQGYCVSKPTRIEEVLFEPLEKRIRVISDNFQNTEREKIIRNKQRFNKLKAITNIITRRLSVVSADKFDDVLLRVIRDKKSIECAYILDEKGIQSSSTVFSVLNPTIKINRLFSPAKIGTDHSLKTYYRYLKSVNARRYITEPYASLASGNLCMTFTNIFQDIRNNQYILCIDFKVSELQDPLITL